MNARERRLGLFAVLVLCVLALPGYGGIIYDDSFESYAVGSAAPSPWNGWYTGNNAITNAVAKTGTQCVDFMSGGSIGRDADKSSIVDGKGTVTLSFKDNGCGSQNFMMYIGEMDTWGIGATYTKVYVNYWGGISAYSNSSETGVQLFSGQLGQAWNTISVSFDIAAATYDVVYNGTLIGDSLAMFNTPNPAGNATILRARIDDWNGANSVIHTYVDDWSLSTVPEPATVCLLGLGLAFFRKRKNS